MGSGSKCTWAYNWGQTPSGMSIGVEYVAMLWSNRADFIATWAVNAAAAIASGTGHLLSFNECDNANQCNLPPSEAASAHIQYMNPWQGKAQIGAPAISNSQNAGQGLDWAKQFIAACAGQCAMDFYPMHWYDQPDRDLFLNYLLAAHEVVKMPIWITEFAPISGSDSDIAAFLSDVMNQMDTNATFSFVDRYAYFMVQDGSLVSGGSSLSEYGNTFAYGG